jgi:hypothetical protein
MAWQLDAQGREINPMTGLPFEQRAAQVDMNTGQMQTDAQANTQYDASGSSKDWIDQNMAGYGFGGGVQTVTGGGIDPATGRTRPTMSHTAMTPETHPWAFGGPRGVAPVDPKGMSFYNADGSQVGGQMTSSGYTGGRQVSPEEQKAYFDSINYFKNGGVGLDPRLMAGMTRTDPMSKTYSNQYGTYTGQQKVYDEKRAAAGLNPWVEKPSSFSGTGLDGKQVNYTNSFGEWGSGNPRNYSVSNDGTSRMVPLGNTPNPNSPFLKNSSPLSNALRYGQSSASSKPSTNYAGMPSNHSNFGANSSQFTSIPQWWQQIMARKPGQT